VRVHFGEFLLDSETRELRRCEEPVHVTPKALELLLALVESRPKALSKAQLQQRLWPGTVVVEASLANLVGELRRALGEDARDPRFVRTVQRFGYAFRLEPEPSASQVARPVILCRLTWRGGRTSLTAGDHVVGRDENAAVRLDSASVSRQHAAIRVTEAGVVLEDLGSKNGTFVGGHRLVAPVRLRDGDAFRIGAVHMKLLIVKPSGSTETVRRSQSR